MKKILFITCFGLLGLNVQAQIIVDFENPILSADTSWFGQDQLTDGDTLYIHDSGHAFFELNYNSGWGTFTGFSISNMTDVITPGYGNQFSAITGEGGNSSAQYSVCYVTEFSNNRVFLTSAAYNFYNVQVTNTTYAYQSMLNGDSFSKPFGADTNAQGVNDGTNGEDWFLLTIYALGTDSLKTGDSINFYLADYTFPSGTDDYIVDTWETIDLVSLYSGNDILGLDFVLSSSDTSGGFGMNSPAYFAMDNLYIFEPGGIDEREKEFNFAYPNPFDSDLTIQTEIGDLIQLFDMNGRLIQEETAQSLFLTWNMSGLEKGLYLLMSQQKGIKRQQKVSKL